MAFAERPTPTVPINRREAVQAARTDSLIGFRLQGTDRVLELPPDRQRVTLGSDPSCDLVIDDPYVSSWHCTLERRNQCVWTVRDRDSKNGTFVNGNRIELADLPVGAQLSIGTARLLALGSHTAAAPSARARLIGDDPAFCDAIDRALLAARSGLSILICGETGTGKELIARAIHEASPRALGPFVAINCGAIPAQLVESELFGHERGAFTGAETERDGVLAQASGGTLFLDELGELPRDRQPAFLRALETRTVRRVGGSRDTPIDVRLVSATNRVDMGGKRSPLRSDLYHRLATVVVHLPPLRARRADIPALVDGFLRELEPEFGLRTIDDETLAALTCYDWPGNVRELRHSVHRAAALSPHSLRPSDLLPRAAEPGASAVRLPSLRAREQLPVYQAAERRLLAEAYREHASIRKAAAALGMAKSTFSDRAHRFGVIRKGKPPAKPG